jgi:hypothetical protein
MHHRPNTGVIAKRTTSEASPQTARQDGGSLRFAGSLVGWPREARGDDIFQGYRQPGGEPRRGLRQIPGRCVKLASIITTSALEDV